MQTLVLLDHHLHHYGHPNLGQVWVKLLTHFNCCYSCFLCCIYIQSIDMAWHSAVFRILVSCTNIGAINKHYQYKKFIVGFGKSLSIPEISENLLQSFGDTRCRRLVWREPCHLLYRSSPAKVEMESRTWATQSPFASSATSGFVPTWVSPRTVLWKTSSTLMAASLLGDPDKSTALMYAES